MSIKTKAGVLGSGVDYNKQALPATGFVYENDANSGGNLEDFSQTPRFAIVFIEDSINGSYS